MSWNFRIIKNDDENSYEICKVYYDDKGNPTFYDTDRSVLSNDSFKGLQFEYKEIEKAFQKPILEFVNLKLVELSVCPQCNQEIIFEKTKLVCPTPEGCGYVAVR